MLFEYIPLPYGVHGYVVQWDVDGYTVFLNSLDAINVQREAAFHEIEHIINHDFDQSRNVNWLEGIRHGT